MTLRAGTQRVGPANGTLQVREGLRGIKPLTDRDRADIRNTIAFSSTAVETGNGRLTVRGELELD